MPLKFSFDGATVTSNGLSAIGRPEVSIQCSDTLPESEVLELLNRLCAYIVSTNLQLRDQDTYQVEGRILRVISVGKVVRIGEKPRS